MKSVERYAFDKSNARNKFRIAVIHVSPIADSECIIDREMETMYVGSNFHPEVSSEISSRNWTAYLRLQQGFHCTLYRDTEKRHEYERRLSDQFL